MLKMTGRPSKKDTRVIKKTARLLAFLEPSLDPRSSGICSTSSCSGLDGNGTDPPDTWAPHSSGGPVGRRVHPPPAVRPVSTSAHPHMGQVGPAGAAAPSGADFPEHTRARAHEDTTPLLLPAGSLGSAHPGSPAPSKGPRLLQDRGQAACAESPGAQKRRALHLARQKHHISNRVLVRKRCETRQCSV